MPDEPRVTLLTRTGCHLCADARATVAGVTRELGIGWQERGVDDDAELRRRYGDLVPVVLVDGRRHACWRVDADRLRQALAGGGTPTGWLRRWRRTP